MCFGGTDEMPEAEKNALLARDRRVKESFNARLARSRRLRELFDDLAKEPTDSPVWHEIANRIHATAREPVINKGDMQGF